MTQSTNRLIHEKSPYLQQHSTNPVDWFPWSVDAFEKAKTENKPIFLSIGYSTCHWCHVMEKESFEDNQVAALLNDHFVSIKVDREERPDIDDIYMTACQLITGSGGWPLTIIMTPDKEPFFAGTYIPKNKKHRRIGLLQLLPHIAQLWKTNQNKINEIRDNVMKTMKTLSQISSTGELDKQIITDGYRALANTYDESHGGFGNAPKFPSAHNLLFLLRYWQSQQDDYALKMVEETLTAMRKGGIFDQIGFGFHRYSTDAKWLVPHFEKMLYDQTLLAIAYTEAYAATANPLFAQTVEEIFEYVLRDMTSDNGGFYSAEDADSEGTEGRFYLWEQQEIEEHFSPDDAKKILDTFRFDRIGNFIDPLERKYNGKNIPHLAMNPMNFDEEIESLRNKLFDIRKTRIHPHKDDKILTDWNGLMIATLAIGGSILNNQKYIAAAQQAFDFIEDTMIQDTHELLHRYKDGEAGIRGKIDDYSFLVYGLIELYQATVDEAYLEWAIVLTRKQIELFWDTTNYGFYTTPSGETDLIIRKKTTHDGATPSGNSVAFMNLLRLSRLTGDSTFEEKAIAMSNAFSDVVNRSPSAHLHLLSGLFYVYEDSYEIIIVCEQAAICTNPFIQKLRDIYLPNSVILVITPENRDKMNHIAPYTAHYSMLDEKPTAYVCHDFECELPTTDPDEMVKMMLADK